MATDLLVENRVEEGRILLRLLVQNGFDVTAAAWVKTSEEERWFLYISSRTIEEKGFAPSYRQVNEVLKSMDDSLISMFEVKLISLKDPMACDLLEVQSRQLGRMAPGHSGVLLGNVPFEEAYVYPPFPPQKNHEEQRKLKKEVSQVARPEDFLFTPQEKGVIRQLVSQGYSRQQAVEWIQKKRESLHPRPPIPAGTVVKTRVMAWWGDKPEDDPNPLLEVEAPEGARGLCFKEDTEPLEGLPIPPNRSAG